MKKEFIARIGMGIGIVAIFGATVTIAITPTASVLPDFQKDPDTTSVVQTTQACGNGKADAGEYCDDGNPWVGDGCALCQIETGYSCEGLPSICAPGTSACGDNQASPDEMCDDGNMFDGDGCSKECALEEGFICEGLPSVCVVSSSSESSGSSESSLLSISSESSVSSQSALSSSASSDSSVPSASSSSIASLSSPSSFSSSSSLKRLTPRDILSMPKESYGESYYSIEYEKPYCGDKLVLNEACDDGDATDGDGCSSTCTIEPGYDCYGNPSTCVIRCGNGIVTSPETCDDGNSINGDGCTSECRLEFGYGCSDAKPNVCRLLTPPVSEASSSS